MVYIFVKGLEIVYIKSVVEIDSCLMREIYNFMFFMISLYVCEFYLELIIYVL